MHPEAIDPKSKSNLMILKIVQLLEMNGLNKIILPQDSRPE